MSAHFLRGRDSVVAYPITVNGIRTRVLEGIAPGRPVVCLHGAGSRADRWTPAVPGLASLGLKPYAIDLPGHGFADKSAANDHTARGLAAFAGEAIAALGLDDVLLVGTSLGGHVASHVALQRPDLVGDLVLVGSVGVVALPDENQTDPAVMADASVAAVRRKLSFVVADAALVSDAWVREESMINSSPGAAESLTAIGEFLRDGCNADLVADRLVAAGLAGRTLVVWGEQDRWTPLPMGEATHAALPGSQFATMPGCGHAPYFEDPDGFVKIMTRRFAA